MPIMFGFFMFFALLGGVNAYIALRLWQCLRCLRPGLSPAWGVGLFAFLLGLLLLGFLRSRLPVGPGTKYALNVTGSVWMGVFIYLFLFLLAGDALRLAGRLLRLIPADSLARSRFLFVVAAVVLTALTCAGGVLHGRKLSVTQYEVPAVTPMEGEVRIALLTDIHLGAVGSEARLPRLVERVNSLEPDVICIAGDFFDNDMDALRDPDGDAALLRQLRSPLGVYMCPGNHDAGATWPQMTDFLERCGVTLLSEEAADVGGRLTLAGRADRSPIGRTSGGKVRGDTRALMNSAVGALPTVVLDHNPAAVNEYDTGDLVLCGHTHKGQIFPGNLFTRRLFPVDYGHYRRDETSPHVIVSSGAGTWGMPMRVGTSNEVVLIRMLGQTGGEAEKGEHQMKTIYLAGGCFWGLQKFIDQFDGVTETEVGYANGPDRAPSYQEVCRNSGHAETVRVAYDEAVISLEKLLDYYFMVIDPLSVNKQGGDEGIQYRTGVYYTDESQRPVIEAVFARETEKAGAPLAVALEPLRNFFSAEEYHQKYLEKNPDGYCHIPRSYFSIAGND